MNRSKLTRALPWIATILVAAAWTTTGYLRSKLDMEEDRASEQAPTGAEWSRLKQEVADLQNAIPIQSGLHHALCARHIQRERFLHEHVFTGGESG